MLYSPNDKSDAPALLAATSFSTSSCQDDYRVRLSIMARELAFQSPDILLLQDVFATADHKYNTAAYLARHLHMRAAFHPARPKMRHLDGRPVDSHCGLAVLSRHHIVASVKIGLPHDTRDGERIAQFVDLDVAGTRLLVVNVRVSHLADKDALRRHQIERLADLLASASDYDHMLVGGDFNAAPKDPALAPLRDLDGFSVCEAAPERGVDRLFGLSRHGVMPISLANAQPALERPDPAANLFPGARAALSADLALGQTYDHSQQSLALQTAAE